MNEPIPPAPSPGDDPLLAPLNEHQREAVVHGDGPLLVLAGAGSGKTRVITHRIAWLVLRRSVAPWNVLAVTFTNKAAGEMRERLGLLLGPVAGEANVSTFHATGAAILRREAEKVGRTRSFVIYDDGDQLQVIRRALAETGVGDRVRPQTVRNRIDHAKNHALTPADLRPAPHDFLGNQVREVWAHYEKLMARADALDFGDLLAKVVALLRGDPETLERYRRRFRHVLVDEFQDTNPVQLELLRLLCPAGRANLCVVGDDDQSIYRWRGADVSNILSFEKEFSGAAVVKLERNYRSDAGILEAAWAVIRKNVHRKEKRLWTDRPRGEPLRLLVAPDERSEAKAVAEAVGRVAAAGTPLASVAVFYRVNAQSRVIEEGMRLAGVPYHVVRGRAFYDRAEVKDAAAYLRAAVNPRSDADLERVINTPARGIGATTLDRVKAFARENDQSLFEALERPDAIPGLNAGARRRLAGFRSLVGRIAAAARDADCARVAVERMLELSGLAGALEAEGTDESMERAENLRELVGAAAEYDRMRAEEAPPAPPEPADPEAGPLRPPQGALEAFLEQISLLGDADSEGDGGRVSLMTLHAAKGLEFDAVFLTGMEEGVFPHSRALAGNEGAPPDPEEIAEERRLCYVGITRARRQLCFSLAGMRSLFGNLKANPPSRFLADLPRELFESPARPPAKPPARPPAGELHLERDEPELGAGDGFESDEWDEFDQRPAHERKRPAPFRPAGRRPAPSSPIGVPAPLVVGSRVRHAQFGDGLVTLASPGGVVTVRFPGLGEKRIVSRFLELVG